MLFSFVYRVCGIISFLERYTGSLNGFRFEARPFDPSRIEPMTEETRDKDSKRSRKK
jgi:hypothetical protein